MIAMKFWEVDRLFPWSCYSPSWTPKSSAESQPLISYWSAVYVLALHHAAGIIAPFLGVLHNCRISSHTAQPCHVYRAWPLRKHVRYQLACWWRFHVYLRAGSLKNFTLCACIVCLLTWHLVFVNTTRMDTNSYFSRCNTAIVKWAPNINPQSFATIPPWNEIHEHSGMRTSWDDKVSMFYSRLRTLEIAVWCSMTRHAALAQYSWEWMPPPIPSGALRPSREVQKRTSILTFDAQTHTTDVDSNNVQSISKHLRNTSSRLSPIHSTLGSRTFIGFKDCKSMMCRIKLL